jgi:drug/metabolite transporter (DMT)-like permease
LAWLLFDEAVTGMTILGTLCTVMGVVLVVKYPVAPPVSRA